MRSWLKSSQLTLNQECVKVPGPVPLERGFWLS